MIVLMFKTPLLLIVLTVKMDCQESSQNSLLFVRFYAIIFSIECASCQAHRNGCKNERK